MLFPISYVVTFIEDVKTRSMKNSRFLADRTAIHSMIGYWQQPVVRPSVCNAVHCGSQGRCTALKSCSNVILASKFLFVPFDTFPLGCIV